MIAEALTVNRTLISLDLSGNESKEKWKKK